MKETKKKIIVAFTAKHIETIKTAKLCNINAGLICVVTIDQ